LTIWKKENVKNLNLYGKVVKTQNFGYMEKNTFYMDKKTLQKNVYGKKYMSFFSIYMDKKTTYMEIDVIPIITPKKFYFLPLN